jgi:arylsulfatase A-like enzyme
VHPHNGVRTDRYKLIHFYTIDAWELFDVEKDPREMKSVYNDPTYATTVADMKKELKRLMAQYKDDGTTVVKFPNPNPPMPKSKGKAKGKGNAG